MVPNLYPQNLARKFHGYRAGQDSLHFYGTRRFIIIFTIGPTLDPNTSTLVQSIPSYPISAMAILIISSQLRLRLQNFIFSWSFLDKIWYAFSYPYSCNMSRLSHRSWCNHPRNTRRRTQIMIFIVKNSLCWIMYVRVHVNFAWTKFV
jgi:hypothetical protein